MGGSNHKAEKENVWAERDFNKAPSGPNIPYTMTIPQRYGVADWYLKQYPSSTTWPSTWDNTYLYDETARFNAPTNIFPIYRYGIQPQWSSAVPHTTWTGSTGNPRQN